MTITPTAPPVTLPTDCPVDWCTEAGNHAWSTDEDGAHERLHELTTMVMQANYSGEEIVIKAEAFERDGEVIELGLDVSNVKSLRSREEVDQLIGGLVAAADMAFGPVSEDVPATPGRDDTAAAMVELMDRALRPHDVNRLVAAAFRYRNACIAAGEIR